MVRDLTLSNASKNMVTDVVSLVFVTSLHVTWIVMVIIIVFFTVTALLSWWSLLRLIYTVHLWSVNRK